MRAQTRLTTLRNGMTDVNQHFEFGTKKQNMSDLNSFATINLY